MPVSTLLRRAALIGTLATTLVACGGSGPPPGAPTTVISFVQLDCSGCGEELAEKIAKREGVYAATFDKRKAELTVSAAAGFDVLAAANADKSDEPFTLVVGAGKGSYLPWKAAPAGGRCSPTRRG